MHPYVHCSTIYNSQDIKATSVEMDKQLDKDDVEHIYNGILFGHEKELNLTTGKNMSGSGGEYHATGNRSD